MSTEGSIISKIDRLRGMVEEQKITLSRISPDTPGLGDDISTLMGIASEMQEVLDGYPKTLRLQTQNDR